MRTYNEQWREILTLPWAGRQKRVAEEVRAALIKFDAHCWSTATLTHCLWPASEGDSPAMRDRFYRSLMAMKEAELADCAERGPVKPKKYMGQVAYAWLWSKPRALTHCPTCGRAYSQEVATEGSHPAPEPPSAETPSS